MTDRLGHRMDRMIDATAPWLVLGATLLCVALFVVFLIALFQSSNEPIGHYFFYNCHQTERVLSAKPLIIRAVWDCTGKAG